MGGQGYYWLIMIHDFDVKLDWCRRCGRSYEEIFDSDLVDCDGLPGVIHARYLRARERAEKVFGPIVEKLRHVFHF